jgi:CheY-like chemotaxis protein
MTASKPRALIVDDEQFLIRSFSRILERAFEVTALTSAREALQRIAAGESWDFILCDLQMPELDGVEFYDELTRTQPGLASRLAFITGGAFTPRVIAFLEKNTRPTLEKPVEPADLLAVAHRIVGTT